VLPLLWSDTTSRGCRFSCGHLPLPLQHGCPLLLP
jgi:hypothetical protein